VTQQNGDVLGRVVAFLQSLGFVMIEGEPCQNPDGREFLPGVSIQPGMTIVYTVSRLESVGDLLHDAGHVAVTPSLFRSQLSYDLSILETLADEYMAAHPFLVDGQEDPVMRGLLQAGEQEAQAWSYAAAVAAGIDPGLVMYADSAERSHSGLVGLRLGQHAGIHGLAAGGMTTCRVFPRMLRWLQG
jgi:hypothetical protein